MQKIVPVTFSIAGFSQQHLSTRVDVKGQEVQFVVKCGFRWKNEPQYAGNDLVDNDEFCIALKNVTIFKTVIEALITIKLALLSQHVSLSATRT